MRLSVIYRTLCTSLVLVSVLGLAQMAQAATPISSGNKLAHDAKKQIGITTSYDPAYRKLEFPRGDVPIESGVCTDVIIRAYRLQNIDLQQLVNHDMKSIGQAIQRIGD